MARLSRHSKSADRGGVGSPYIQGESKNKMNTTLTILLLSLLPIAGFALRVFGNKARTPTTRVPRGITCPQGSPRGRDRILGRDAMKLIIPIGTMCCLIFILARIALLLATPEFPPEFLQWLAQSGPMEWFFMAIGAVIIWGVIGYPLFFLHPKDWVEYWMRHQG
jgi:hypothetical protein